MIISLVGAYDREQIQAFLNPLISHGGVQEIRLLKMGSEPFFTDLVSEMKLVHDMEKIFAVDIKTLLLFEDETPEVLIFMNSSYKTISDFCTVAFPLLEIIVDEMGNIENLQEMKILFGDNYRGVLQHAYLEKLLQKSSIDSTIIQISGISSVFEMSKILNSTTSDSYFRCYPKIDETHYLFDPSQEMSADSENDLAEELNEQIATMEHTFTKKSASSYPNIEGTNLFRCISTYIQKKNWDLALSVQWLVSRNPTERELEMYGLKWKVPVFLPAEENEKLPDLVVKHMQDASNIIGQKIGLADEV